MPEILFFPWEEIVTPLYLDGTNTTLVFDASPVGLEQYDVSTN